MRILLSGLLILSLLGDVSAAQDASDNQVNCDRIEEIRMKAVDNLKLNAEEIEIFRSCNETIFLPKSDPSQFLSEVMGTINFGPGVSDDKIMILQEELNDLEEGFAK